MFLLLFFIHIWGSDNQGSLVAYMVVNILQNLHLILQIHFRKDFNLYYSKNFLFLKLLNQILYHIIYFEYVEVSFSEF
jgi:hypothetical protein